MAGQTGGSKQKRAIHSGSTGIVLFMGDIPFLKPKRVSFDISMFLPFLPKVGTDATVSRLSLIFLM